MSDQQVVATNLSKAEGEEDKALDKSLRPQKLEDFIGQTKAKRALKVFIAAAKQRNEPMEHALLYGPPGLGKTTLAYILANEMGVNIRITSGPAIERAGDLASILTNLAPGDILFVDEIHRLNKTVEETLYPAMEDYCLDVVLGKGPSARTLRLDLPRFTIIGATTRVGMLSSPLRDRFGLIHKLEYYDTPQLVEVVKRSARVLEVMISTELAERVATRSRGTPRIANKLLKRVRDVAQIRQQKEISEEVINEALEMLDIDELGLDWVDRKLLEVVIKNFRGGPVGLSTLATAVSEDRQTLEDVI